MPGQARRVWSMHQFCSRVVYSTPQIALPTDYWPSISPPHTPFYARGTEFFLDLRQPSETDQVPPYSISMLRGFAGRFGGELIMFHRALPEKLVGSPSAEQLNKSAVYEMVEGDPD